jgi:hypothetical protein
MAPDNSKRSKDSSVDNSQLGFGNPIPDQIDKMREERLIRKMDFRLIPLVMLIYLFSFLDRGK